ncbi:hypothetical protein DFP72DRAFT_416196 [Ephemerocybe angulata]|uniref:GRIP domain-containing protein n=1 Tax=Ephemerocybe angulata TaxID=980116 RepID=A0A8H6IGU7_9AGAR|nr:hypothetical protein DFP72DRAFT_416196 [Tulosesus angulatus]
MSVDGDGRAGSHSRNSSASYSSNPRVSLDGPTNPPNLNGLAPSTDSAHAANGHSTTAPPMTNGVKQQQKGSAEEDEEGATEGEDTVEGLRQVLERTREEKEALASQYSTLLGKLTDMRTRLGTKLKQDAEELDRREQMIQSLSTQIEDLSATVDTLKEELITSHQESERSSRELDALRARTLQESSQESFMRERELRDCQLELEKSRMEKDEWERLAQHEKALSEDARSTADELRRELELEREVRAREAEVLAAEQEKAANLQSVLQDFQAAKDHELRQAVKDYDAQLQQVTLSLAEFKHRAHTAELKLEESHSNISRTQELENQVKEKNLLIGKLRHETVIINEHLVEALRRLRKSSSETNVDRRLVTNVFLSYLNTPRGDSKRFEMLNLMASILSWTDVEKEKAGIQKSGSVSLASPASGFWGRSLSSGGLSSAAKSPTGNTDETESFSRLWVEFLLTEAAAGDQGGGNLAPPTRGNSSLPGSPTTATHTLSPPTQSRRISSLSAVASTPDLMSLPSLGSKLKGKEREHVPLPEDGS